MPGTNGNNNYDKNPSGASAMILTSTCEDSSEHLMPNLAADPYTTNDDWETSSNVSNTSSVDSVCGFFNTRYEEDYESTASGEGSAVDSDHSEHSTTCSTCLKPQ